LWERECSIQRRYQKVVELAVSTVGDRRVVGRVIEAAVRMAERVSCFGDVVWVLLSSADFSKDQV
jgi:acetyl/propionyl-CoA carboxylase alpha subunit